MQPSQDNLGSDLAHTTATTDQVSSTGLDNFRQGILICRICRHQKDCAETSSHQSLKRLTHMILDLNSTNQMVCIHSVCQPNYLTNVSRGHLMLSSFSTPTWKISARLLSTETMLTDLFCWSFGQSTSWATWSLTFRRYWGTITMCLMSTIARIRR